MRHKYTALSSLLTVGLLTSPHADADDRPNIILPTNFPFSGCV